MADTKLDTTVHTQVKVSWEDKPFSPIFAAYQNDGATGIGITLHQAPALSLDALGLIPTGSRSGVSLGLGLEHVFKGTSAGIGIDATFNTATRKPQFGIFAAIHN